MAFAQLPALFGRYRLVEKVGEGGMGTVYLADDTQLGRHVALKIPRLVDTGPQALERFQREAQLGARLEHPYLCPILDVGEVEGVHYLTMPFIEGSPLAHRVGPGLTWPPIEAITLAAKLARALEFLHDRGLMHRDLKPGNVLIRPMTDEPVLVDFGLARPFHDAAIRLTRTGQQLGTPAYMAPEQVLGQGQGPATDVYALGVILYEMLTGEVPITGPLEQVGVQILHTPPRPPSLLRPSLGSQEDELVLRALAKDPCQRYASASEFAAALEGYLQRNHTWSPPLDVFPADPSPGTEEEPATACTIAEESPSPPATAPVISLAVVLMTLLVFVVCSVGGVLVWWVVQQGPPSTSSDARKVPGGQVARSEARMPPSPGGPVPAHAKARPHNAPGLARALPAPVRLLPIDPGTIHPGGTLTIPVRISRQGCCGEVGLDVRDLPADVRALSVPVIPPFQDQGMLKLQAVRSARVRQFDVTLQVIRPIRHSRGLTFSLTVANPSLPKTVTNSRGMKLVLVPKGECLLGSPGTEPGRDEDETQRRVTITRDFYMGAYEVTQEQFGKLMGVHPSHFSRDGGRLPGSEYPFPPGDGKDRLEVGSTSNFPVENVSWEDAVLFCQKLSQLPAERAKGSVYRLPTEAQWEYACRAGKSTTPLHTGKTLEATQANFDGRYPYGKQAHGKYLKRTSAVGSYRPNLLGLYDMHGNVWEWCQDWYGAKYPSTGPRTDPRGPDIGTRKVLRGGSYASQGRDCRSAYRHRVIPTVRLPHNGFRVVMEVRR